MTQIAGFELRLAPEGHFTLALRDEYGFWFHLDLGLVDSDTLAWALLDEVDKVRRSRALTRRPELEGEVISAIDRIRRQNDAV
jgi:hypothetical protein